MMMMIVYRIDVYIVLMMASCLMSEPFRTAGIFLSFVVDAVDVQIQMFLSLFQMSKLVASRRVSSFVSRTMFVICHCTRALSQCSEYVSRSS